MSKENVEKFMQVLARNLNQQVSSIDLTKSFDDNGGDSIALMSTVKDLRQMNWMVSLDLFESPNSLQDIIQYVENCKQQAAERLKIERFANVRDKDELIDMCSRSFAERNILEGLLETTASDLHVESKSVADLDSKRSLSLVVFDTNLKRYVGGAFMHDFMENDYKTPKVIAPITEIVDYLKKSFQQESDTNNLLYIALRFAEPNLSAAIHVEIFQLLMVAIMNVAKENNFRGVVSVTINPVTAVSIVKLFLYHVLNYMLFYVCLGNTFSSLLSNYTAYILPSKLSTLLLYLICISSLPFSLLYLLFIKDILHYVCLNYVILTRVEYHLQTKLHFSLLLLFNIIHVFIAFTANIIFTVIYSCDCCYFYNFNDLLILLSL